MKTVKTSGNVSPDGNLRIEVPSGLPPGPVDIVLVLEPRTPQAPPRAVVRWEELEGLGKEIWHGEDAQAYVNRLREEWGR